MPLPLPIVEELLEHDLVVLDRIDTDPFERDLLAIIDGLVVMDATGYCPPCIVSLQEPAESVFFQVFLGLGIECLHLVEFFRRQFGEMAKEVNQLPTIYIFIDIAVPPGGHRSKADAVVNDPKYLSVRH